MSDLMFVTMDGGGNVPPMLEIAHAASRAGHRVRVLGHERLRDQVTSHDLDLIAFQHTHPWDATREQSVLRWAPMVNDRGMLNDVHRECSQDRPDCAVVDCMIPPAHAAVDRLGIPRIVLTHTYKAFYDGPFRRTSAVISRFHGYNAARQWDSARANLVTTMESLDPAARSRHATNVEWTGVVGPPASPSSPGDGPPLVLVSLSTNGFPGQRRTLQRIIAALGELRVRAVVTTGGVFAPEEFNAPVNVRVLGYADHLSILPKCSLVVAHGGHSTTFRALAHDVPLLTIPTSLMTDQPMIGRSIARAGAGRVLRRTASVRTIRTEITHILSEQSFRDSAGALGAEIRKVDGAANAVTAIERHMDQ